MYGRRHHRRLRLGPQPAFRWGQRGDVRRIEPFHRGLDRHQCLASLCHTECGRRVLDRWSEGIAGRSRRIDTSVLPSAPKPWAQSRTLPPGSRPNPPDGENTCLYAWRGFRVSFRARLWHPVHAPPRAGRNPADVSLTETTDMCRLVVVDCRSAVRQWDRPKIFGSKAACLPARNRSRSAKTRRCSTWESSTTTSRTRALRFSTSRAAGLCCSIGSGT